MRRVCIIQAVAKQYRRPFFDLLHKRLQVEGVDLKVIYSDPNDMEACRKDSVDLPIAYGHKVSAYWFFRYRLLYQSCLKKAIAVDLVIVEQASKHLLNYIFAVLRIFGLIRMGFWGHGRNWQQDGTQWMEPIKHSLLRRADWWFAYTSRVAQYVTDNGFSREHVTVVQNSVDLDNFKKEIKAFDKSQQLLLRGQLGIPPDAPVGLFCGSMHASKKLDFLVEAALDIHARVPGFHLILVGAGPEESVVREAARTHSWIHYVGPKFGVDKVSYFTIADIFLCPGLVGLSVLEAFAAGLPLFTTNIPVHSPEIDYLTDSVTGVITNFDPVIYAEAVSACLLSPASLMRMRVAAREASQSYSLESMVENFAQGVIACLKKF